jgi:hypothetical protein
MGKRVTVMIDDNLLKKLRRIQANQIKESAKSISFSSVINQILEKELK